MNSIYNFLKDKKVRELDETNILLLVKDYFYTMGYNDAMKMCNKEIKEVLGE